MNLKMFGQVWNTYISCSTHTFYIIRMPISYSRCGCGLISSDFSSMYHYKFIIGHQKTRILQISKKYKKTDHKKNNF